MSDHDSFKNIAIWIDKPGFAVKFAIAPVAFLDLSVISNCGSFPTHTGATPLTEIHYFVEKGLERPVFYSWVTMVFVNEIREREVLF